MSEHDPATPPGGADVDFLSAEDWLQRQPPPPDHPPPDHPRPSRSRWALLAGLAFVLLSGGVVAVTPSLRVNGIKFRPTDQSVWLSAYGCKCDGSTDDSTCLANAFTAVNALGADGQTGGVIHVPNGRCMFGTPWNMQGAINVRIVGDGGMAQGFGGSGSTTKRPGSVLVYTGTGSTSAVQLNSAFGTRIEHLGILYSSASFTGVLIDYSRVTSDAEYNTVSDVLLGADGLGAWNAKALISWNRADYNKVVDTHFQGAKAGVRFRETNADYSVVNTIEHCMFRDMQTGAVMNAQSKSVIANNVFEPNTNQTGGPTMAPAYTDDLVADGTGSTTQNDGMVFTDNWIGDGDASTNVFDSSPGSVVTMYGASIIHNFMGGTVHFASMKNSIISINDFFNPVTFDVGGTYLGLQITNNPGHGTWSWVNLPAAANVWGNSFTAGSQTVGDQFTLAGPISQTGSNTFSTGTGAVSLNGATTVASAKALSSAGGAANFDWSSSSGTFATSSGSNTLNGATTIASGKNLSSAGGTSDLDWSASSGAFKTSTGTTTIDGALCQFSNASGTKTFNVAQSATDTAGRSLIIASGQAGTVSSSGGQLGGALTIQSADGIAGTAGLAGGAANNLTFKTGAGGTNNGGGGGNAANMLFSISAAGSGASGGQFVWQDNGTNRMQFDPVGVNLKPSTDNTAQFGDVTRRWSQAWVARYMMLPQTIAAASSITIAPSSGDKVSINLSSTAITSVTYTAGNDGEHSVVCVAQDGTGGRTIATTWTNVRFAGGSYTATSTLNKIDCLRFIYDSTASAWLEVGRAMAL